jgi:hypothetical protein
MTMPTSTSKIPASNTHHMIRWSLIAVPRQPTSCSAEFDRRHKARGVRATAVHPGGIKTELGRHMQPQEIDGFIAQVNAQAAAIASRRSNGRPYRKARLRGLLSSHQRAMSGATTARIAKYQNSLTDRLLWQTPALAHMRAIPSVRKHSGLRAKRWCGSASKVCSQFWSSPDLSGD